MMHKKTAVKSCLVFSGFVVSTLISLPLALAQVQTDGSLSTTVTSSGGQIFTIDDGDQVGGNLFHSFEAFSVPTSGAAIFNNAVDVERIINRVTGDSVSTIDGLIQANGTADLFLINPNGLIFGPGAQLDIGGSFVGSTASSLRFADGVVFETGDTTSAPLLTVSAPVGLQLTPESGAIQVQNTGHALSDTSSSFLNTSTTASGLAVQSTNTLALVGSDLYLEGGILTAESGRIELGSVTAGEVQLQPEVGRLALEYSADTDFGDIQMRQQTLVQASDSGSIQIQGGTIELLDGSMALIQNQGTQPGGELRVESTEAVRLIGLTPDGELRSGLRSEAVFTGKGAGVNVVAPHLFLQGGTIQSRTFGSADGGDINLTIAEDIEAERFWLTDDISEGGTISTQTSNSGHAGNITLTTERLSLRDGGFLGSLTFGEGNGGRLHIQAPEFIELIADADSPGPSILSSSSIGVGQGGLVTLDTRRVGLLGSGVISSSAYGNGDAGSLVINATESVEVSGDLPGAVSPSRIESVISPFPELQRRQSLGLPDVPSGGAGDIVIHTGELQVTDGAQISVSNEGIGNAGNLKVIVDSLVADQGSITASTQSGEGGSLNLQAHDLVLLRNHSLISAEAGGNGNGGNIILSAPVIVGLENSDIVANAFQGNGGNIDITTQGILGLEFRNALTSESDITASSEFGVSGVVEITHLTIDPSSGIVELPEAVADPSQQITASCSEAQSGQFIATGRGGLPPNPTGQVHSDRTWSDLRDLSDFRNQPSEQPLTIIEQSALSPDMSIVEASDWQRDAQGRLKLVAIETEIVQSIGQPMTCAANPNHRSAI